MNHNQTFTLIAIIVPVIHLLGIANAAHAIMGARTPQASSAWAIALISFPYLAIPLYWIFGAQTFEKYGASLRDAHSRHADHLQDLLGPIKPFAVRAEGYARLLEGLSGWPMTSGNQIDLLVDGAQTFQAIFAAIESAKICIALEFFIVRDDELGRELKQRLIRKAKEGVRVYFLCDQIGSWGLSKSYVADLRAAGIQFSFFRTSDRSLTGRFRLNFRNHRKIVVVDGRTALVGGLNVGDEYLGKSARFGHWRDTHVQIKGPAVLGVQIIFAADWYWMEGQAPNLFWGDPEAAAADVKLLPLASGPEQRWDVFPLALGGAIQQAKKRLWIASPYFVPDEGFLQALQLAALRGVDVRILLPKKPDHMLVYLASFSYMADLIPCGVKLYRYNAGFLHQKVFLVDDHLASVGTANIDNRSFRLNFEVSMLVLDRNFCGQVAKMLEDDFQHGEPQAADDLKKRSYLFQIGVRAARLLAPIL